MRKIVLISALVLGSSVAFAQFTGPVVDNSESNPRATMHQASQSEKGYGNQARHSDRAYRGEHRRHGDMKQNVLEQRSMHRDSSRRGSHEMHRNGNRHSHHHQ